MKSQLYRSVTTHNGLFVWQLTVLGRPLRSNEHFKDAESAAIDVDLVKWYFFKNFKLELTASVDPEQWSCLIFSRHNVALADNLSVERALHPCVREFVALHKAELEAYRDAQPEESVFSKFRRSDAFNRQADIRAWVQGGEAAIADAAAFAAVDSDSFFLRLKVVASSLTTALKSLKLAIKMHNNATNPRLVQRGKNLAELVHNFQLNLDYVTELTSNMRAEQTTVEHAVSNLEANRPSLA